MSKRLVSMFVPIVFLTAFSTNVVAVETVKTLACGDDRAIIREYSEDENKRPSFQSGGTIQRLDSKISYFDLSCLTFGTHNDSDYKVFVIFSGITDKGEENYYITDFKGSEIEIANDLFKNHLLLEGIKSGTYTSADGKKFSIFSQVGTAVISECDGGKAVLTSYSEETHPNSNNPSFKTEHTHIPLNKDVNTHGPHCVSDQGEIRFMFSATGPDSKTVYYLADPHENKAYKLTEKDAEELVFILKVD